MAIDLPFTDFNIRWYHVFSTIAFLVANLWNFQLNRLWTFRSAAHASWIREYLPFLAVGLLGQLVGLADLDAADAPRVDLLAVAHASSTTPPGSGPGSTGPS